jgi:Tol biopolymer transport system component
VAEVGGLAFDISVAREGSRLAYTDRYSDTNIWRLEALPAAQKASTRRGSGPSKLITSSRGEDSPQFSPDGKKIVFASNRSGSWELWTCESDGSNPAQLTSFGGSVTGSPRYSPDGKQIAFDSRPAGQADIFIISAEGGRPRRLTMEDSTDVLPSWSRDGQSIYFSSNRGGDRQIWKVSAEGGPATQVTRHGGFEAFESSDGRFLYYTKERDVGGIWRVPVEGGEETLLPELREVRQYRYWVLTESGIYFVPETTSPRPTINFFNFTTGKVREVAKAERPMFYGPAGLAVSPDGHWILYAQEDQTSSDIMLVSNLQ